MARPTDYNDTIIPQLNEYVASCNREATELPTHEGFAIKLGVNTDTIQEWKDKHKEFSVACKKLMDKQKNQLINDGLYGGKEVNQAMAIFLLKANHGMIETEKKIFETDKFLININTDAKSKLYGFGTVPAETA